MKKHKTKKTGKRLSLARVPLRRNRGSAGNAAIKLAPGDRVAMVKLVTDPTAEVLLGSRAGQIARVAARDISCPKGRASRGVRLLALRDGDEVQAAAIVAPEDEERDE